MKSTNPHGEPFPVGPVAILVAMTLALPFLPGKDHTNMKAPDQRGLWCPAIEQERPGKETAIVWTQENRWQEVQENTGKPVWVLLTDPSECQPCGELDYVLDRAGDYYGLRKATENFVCIKSHKRNWLQWHHNPNSNIPLSVYVDTKGEVFRTEQTATTAVRLKEQLDAAAIEALD